MPSMNVATHSSACWMDARTLLHCRVGPRTYNAMSSVTVASAGSRQRTPRTSPSPAFVHQSCVSPQPAMIKSHAREASTLLPKWPMSPRWLGTGRLLARWARTGACQTITALPPIQNATAERWEQLLASENLEDQLCLIERARRAAAASGALD
ncbi:hypothetical protein HPB50_004665 [Hyalomma asiaticum]|uniref:Uncharacterized protein n=1 Tax=Hyalomma asiaticum TaxID=266040 RepID=A0ACB7RML9_HYAAI|nr:hypothetical protein HPB50_004665 [Hyalomma asiaticum]